MPLAKLHPTLAGVFDPGGGLGPDDARVVQMALPVREGADRIENARLVAARVDGSTAGVAGGDVADPRCLLVGLVFDAEEAGGRPGAGGSSRQAGTGWERRLAAGFRRGGSSMLDGIFGAFVLLLWDEEGRRGLIAQDQLGGRSLYYFARGRRLYFASDVAALLRLLPGRPPPDDLTLAHRVANAPPPPERTDYEGVRRLCGGHLLELGDEGWRRTRYWAPEYRSPARTSRPELQDRLWAAASGAVRRRMAGDGKVGIVMSGGLDSTVVAAAAMEGAADGLSLPRGYSAVFPGRPELDESERIDRLTGYLGLPGVRMEPRPGGIIPLMLEYLRAWDVPVAGPGYLLERPLLERAAADGISVLLDGQGGDEVFSLSPYLVADRLRRGRVLSSLRLARGFPSRADSPPFRSSLILWKRFGLEPAMPGSFHETRNRRRRGRWLADLAPDAARQVREHHDELAWKKDRTGPLWWAFKASLLVQGRERVGLPDYLRHRAAMAGMEARPPFLDLELVRFVLGYPPEMDFGRYSRPNIRGALRERVPEEVRLDRRKSNLASFYHEGWVGPELPMLRSILLDRSARVRRFVRPGTIEALLADPPMVGARGWMSFGPRVWGLLGVECFLRHQEGSGFGERVLGSAQLALGRARAVVTANPSNRDAAGVPARAAPVP